MRILFGISSFEVGGTELHALKAMKTLQAAGHEVAVIVARPVGDITSHFTDNFPVFTYQIRSLFSPSHIHAVRQIRSALRSWQPDVVHALDKYSNAVLLPTARMMGVKRVIGSKRWFLYQPPQYRYINAVSFRFAHTVTANARAISRTLVESDWVPSRKVDVIWNIVDDEMFVQPDASWLSEQRETFQIPEGARVVGMVARLSPVKDHETFLRSFALVHQTDSRAVAVCVGDGPLAGALRHLALDLGIQDAVRFVGYQPNVPNLNWLFDVAVLTSVSEGSPNSILEAMAAGCPVVASRVGGLLDITEFGPPAALVPPGDAPGFAKEILCFLHNAPEALQLRQERSQMIQRQFSPEQFVKKSEQVYRL